MRNLFCFLILFFTVSILRAQVTYQGPATGNVNSGAVQTTNIFGSDAPLTEPVVKEIRNEVDEWEKAPYYINFPEPSPAENELPHFNDLNAVKPEAVDNMTVLLNDFGGNPMGGSIPPDPHMAAGPQHIITTTNSTFRIYDKQGNLLKHINADGWNLPVNGNPNAFDPQIIYDHYAGRWVMLWDNQSTQGQTAFFFISVSDDSDPLGTWYLWSLPANTNGNTEAHNWGDYPGMGFDDKAIYILSRQFPFGSGQMYDKIRIISKDEIYGSNGGALSWKDIWAISYPDGSGRPDGIRPCITYGPTTDAYFLQTEWGGGNAVNFYKLSNPLTNPVLTGVSLSVPYYTAPPEANQLGGNMPIEPNGANLMMTPRLFNGNIYFVHAVRSSQNANYSAIKYVKINTSGPSIADQFSYGTTGFFYLFPALEIDKDGNVAVNFTRSGDTEFAGAFYTSRLANDPPGFNPSYILKPGMGNYVVTYGGDRNRWGDYHGIYRDPADQNNFWMFTEYVPTRNKWGTWIGQIRLVPFPGTYVYTQTPEVNFGNIELTHSSDTTEVVIKNYGADDLVITDIPQDAGPFHRLNFTTFPVTLGSYDSLILKLRFTPADTGNVQDMFSITSNNTQFDGITVKGKGYVINTAARNVLFGSSGSFNDGTLLNINPFTGNGQLVGPSLYPEIESITIDPATDQILGVYSGSSVPTTELVRINSQKGDAYLIGLVKAADSIITDVSSIAYNSAGVLYGFRKNGQIYEINPLTGEAFYRNTASIQISSAAFNPLTGELWASVYQGIGSGKDKIYKIDIATGNTVFIGNTGLNLMTNSMIFDGAGELYGTIGNASQVSNFIRIDTVTAVGTIVGPVNYPNITGLAYFGDKFTGVEDQNNGAVSTFSLGQNYPNPFNPNTVISYSIPFSSDVTLTIFNILGETVKVLVNKEMNAGRYSVNWQGDDNAGSKVSSGVYFYELKASSVKGEKYSELKKMILLK